MSVQEPLVSLMLCVRNGMPHIVEALESVRALTYPNVELVIQDGASTDGTLQYLQNATNLPRFSLVSEPDTGIGHGFNRALQRCRGDIIGSIDADNRLHKEALAIVVRGFREHPEAAVIYGACDMINVNGEFVHSWIPSAFDLFGLMDGTIVPPFATSFFSRAHCGSELRFDEDLVTVADFDLWLRLSHLNIVRIFEVLADVRSGPQSTTWTPELYERHCHYKITALRRFLGTLSRQRVLEQLLRRAEAGIYLWAVDSFTVIDGGQEWINSFFKRAASADLRSERFRDVISRARPRVDNVDSGFDERLLDCGLEFLRRGRAATALVYFELLTTAQEQPPHLDDLIAECRRKIVDELKIQCDPLLSERQAEIDLRDRLLASTQASLQAEIERRDKLLSEKQAEIDQTLAEVARRDGIIKELESRGRINTALGRRKRKGS